MYCRHCGAANQDTCSFCMHCGQKLESNVQAPMQQMPIPRQQRQPMPQQPPRPQVPQQPKRQQIPAQAPNQTPKPKKNIGLILIILLLICLLIAAAVAIIFLLTDDDSKEKTDSNQLIVDSTPNADDPAASQSEPQTTHHADPEPSAAPDPTYETHEEETPAPDTTLQIVPEVDLVSTFTTKERRSVNIFLSNFSEQHFEHYDSSTDNYDLVDFAYMHVKINNPNALGMDGGYYTISQHEVDQALYRFFGRTVEHYSVSKTFGNYTSSYDYRNNAYYTPAADGETHPYFSVATQMYRNSDGTYSLYFNVYELDLDTYFEYGMTNEIYEMSISEAQSRSDVTFLYSGYAHVRDYDGGSYQSYQIISYQINR